MRQQITQASRKPTRRIDSSSGLCKSKRNGTDTYCKLRAYYWQSLLFRQAQRNDLFFTWVKQAQNGAWRFPLPRNWARGYTLGDSGNIQKRPMDKTDIYHLCSRRRQAALTTPRTTSPTQSIPLQSPDAEQKKPAGRKAGRGSITGRACYATFIVLWVSIRCCTTPGSARVEISPRPSYSAVAILRRIRRMIFPERVFGRPGAH